MRLLTTARPGVPGMEFNMTVFVDRDEWDRALRQLGAAATQLHNRLRATGRGLRLDQHGGGILATDGEGTPIDWATWVPGRTLLTSEEASGFVLDTIFVRAHARRLLVRGAWQGYSLSEVVPPARATAFAMAADACASIVEVYTLAAHHHEAWVAEEAVRVIADGAFMAHWPGGLYPDPTRFWHDGSWRVDYDHPTIHHRYSSPNSGVYPQQRRTQ